jgi:aminomethyltransferase
MGNLLSGPNALALEKVTNDASTLTVGKAQYSCLPNDQGGIVDDLLIYKEEVFTSCQCVKYR